MSLLLREAIGASLRRTRTSQRRSLREVARHARVSLWYLSEVERGRKEASSELLAAICTALALPMPELLAEAAALLRPVSVSRVPIGLQPTELRLAPLPHRPLRRPVGQPRSAAATDRPVASAEPKVASAA